jgi:hypothetical protein
MPTLTPGNATREARKALTAAGHAGAVRKITSCVNGLDGTCTLVDVGRHADFDGIRSVLADLPGATRVFGTGMCIIVSRKPQGA